MNQRCVLLLAGVLTLAACGRNVTRTGNCDSDNAGLRLPSGFCARIYSDRVGVARHLAVAPNGDVYLALEDAGMASAGTTKMRGKLGHGGVLLLRDTDHDGRADVTMRIDSVGGSGILLHDDHLYFSTPNEVLRYTLDPNQPGKVLEKQTIVTGIPGGGHSSRSLTLGDSGTIFVNVGSNSNVCGSDNPCGELSERAGIWRFDAQKANQAFNDGFRYATGIRNAVGLVWNAGLHSLFATQHGRDGLGGFKQYSAREGDELPSEEFMRVTPGDDFGWPYCYHDWRTNTMVLAPEYGGDGHITGSCAKVKLPLMGFPGHWAPDGLAFYAGSMFPARYNGGAFIAFHGSWNRRKHDGYKVVFVPFNGAMPQGDYEVFADGFAGRNMSPGGAAHRPVGLAVAPDGSLYITDDQRGRIYNIRYLGSQ